MARRSAGFTILEVVVALAIVAIIALAFVGWQATGLRAARSAAQTREFAAALRYETTLARLVGTGSDAGCRGDHGVLTCQLTSSCLDAGAVPGTCSLVRTTVAVSVQGREAVTATTVGYAVLEAAPTAPPAVEPATDPTASPDPAPDIDVGGADQAGGGAP